jgi:hypothetical protein
MVLAEKVQFPLVFDGGFGKSWFLCVVICGGIVVNCVVKLVT